MSYDPHMVNAPIAIGEIYKHFPQYLTGNSLRLPASQFALWAEEYASIHTASLPRVCDSDMYKMPKSQMILVSKQSLSIFDTQKLAGLESLEPIDKGKRLEGPIISYLQNHLGEHLGLQHITIERDEMTYSNPSYRILSCKVDGIIKINGQREGCLEVKTYWGTTQPDFLVSGGRESQTCGLNQNHKYWFQIQAYLHMMNLSFGVMAVYLGQVDQLLMIPVRKDTDRFNDVYRQMCSRYLTELFMPEFATREEKKKGISYKLSPQLLQNMTDFLAIPAPSSNAQFYLQAHQTYYAHNEHVHPHARQFYGPGGLDCYNPKDLVGMYQTNDQVGWF